MSCPARRPLGGVPAGVLVPPHRDHRPGRCAGLEDLVPGDQGLAPGRDDLGHLRREPALELVRPGQPERLAPLPGPFAGLPLGRGAFVPADMHIRAGKDVHYLFEHFGAEPDGRLLQVEHVLAYPPVRGDLQAATGIAELGVGGHRRLHVPGHVYLGHDGDKAPGRISHNFGQVVLGVEAAVRGAVITVFTRRGRRGTGGATHPPRSGAGSGRPVPANPGRRSGGGGARSACAGWRGRSVSGRNSLGKKCRATSRCTPLQAKRGPSSISTPSTSTPVTAAAGAERSSAAGSNWRNVRVP